MGKKKKKAEESVSSSEESNLSSNSSKKSRSPERKKINIKKKLGKNTYEILHKTQKEKEKKITERLGYTNESNPFGDPNLGRLFIWNKNLENVNVQDLTEDNLKKKNEKYLDEIKILKQKRAQREIDKVRIEEEQMKLNKERGEDNYEMWLEKENKFHEEQAKKRFFRKKVKINNLYLMNIF